MDIRLLNRDFVSAIVTSSLVFLAAALIPLVGPFIGLFLPLPVFIHSYRLGRARGAAVLVLSLAVVSAVVFFSALDLNLMLLLLAGSFGLVLAEIFRKGWSLEKTVFHAVLSVLILGSSLLVYHVLTTGQDPMRLVEAYVSEAVQESIGVYAQLGISAEQLGEIRKNAPLIVRTTVNLFPALVIVGTLSFVLINILAGRAVFQKLGTAMPDFGDLGFWKIPDHMVWFVILAGGLLLVPRGDVRIVALNLLIVFLFIYLFQGFAIIHYFFQKKNVPLFLRGIVYFFIFVQNFLFLIVMLLGFSDIWIDFRKRNRPAEDSVEQP